MTCDWFELAVPGVQGLQPYQPGKPVDELERELGITRAVKLASNENPLGPSPLALARLPDLLQELSRYPDGNGFRLKAALASHLSVQPQQLTLGNGSNEVLELLARAYIKPGDEAIFAAHSFAVYPLVTQVTGGRAVVTPVNNWITDLDAMADAVTANTRIIFIANPNNPTGTWIKSSELQDFLGKIPERVIVVLDEAYFEYVDEPDYPQSLGWLQQFPNLVVTRTFSKIYGLAGLRVGYAISNPEIANILNRVRQPFNINSLALAAAEAALGDIEHVQNSRRLNAAELNRICRQFEDLGLEYIPSVGNFVAVDVKQEGRKVFDALLQKGVIVRPVDNYGMHRHIRVTVGLREENDRFLDALGEVLKTKTG